MTPSLGFAVVSSANMVVMLCSLLGIPTSTTQCQVQNGFI
jgi:phosphate/sulfate permease